MDNRIKYDNGIFLIKKITEAGKIKKSECTDVKLKVSSGLIRSLKNSETCKHLIPNNVNLGYDYNLCGYPTEVIYKLWDDSIWFRFEGRKREW